MDDDLFSSLSGAVMLVADLLGTVIGKLWNQLQTVLHYPLMSMSRIYFLYLASALLFALFVFSRSLAGRSIKPARFLAAFTRFIFPSSVWKESSAWLDVRYFFFHSMLWVSAFGSLSIYVRGWATENSVSLLASPAHQGPLLVTQNYFLGGIIYMFVLMTLSDLTAFLIHYLQHKVSFL